MSLARKFRNQISNPHASAIRFIETRLTVHLNVFACLTKEYIPFTEIMPVANLTPIASAHSRTGIRVIEISAESIVDLNGKFMLDRGAPQIDYVASEHVCDVIASLA